MTVAYHTIRLKRGPEPYHLRGRHVHRKWADSMRANRNARRLRELRTAYLTIMNNRPLCAQD